MVPSAKITKKLTVRGWGGGGSTLTVSLTVKYPFFLLTTSLSAQILYNCEGAGKCLLAVQCILAGKCIFDQPSLFKHKQSEAAQITEKRPTSAKCYVA